MDEEGSRECPRCQGFMVACFLEGFEGDWAVERYFAFRCITCGTQQDMHKLHAYTTNPGRKR